jgi:hypothetical protein
MLWVLAGIGQVQRGWVLDELHPGLVRLSMSVTSRFRATGFWFFMENLRREGEEQPHRWLEIT